MANPTVKDILELYDKAKDKWVKSKLQDALIEDNRFYELDFLKDLNIPAEFKKDATVLPTARDRLDSLVDHTDISHARITVNKRSKTGAEFDRAEMLEKFGLGLINRVNVESDISPLRVSAKHYWLHGITWIKSVYDSDTWERDKGKTLPIILQAINPTNIVPDPYYNGRNFIFEVRKKLVYDAKNSPFKWDNPQGLSEDTEVEQIEYWDKEYRCILINREPVWKAVGGVVEHKYGFLPYTGIESGLGNIDVENNLVKRYVGILRYMKDLLISQSSIYSMCDILTKLETMTGGYVTGADADTIGKISQAYGKWYPMGERDVKFNKWERNLAPREAYAHLAYITDLIDIHSAPKSMFGLGEEGVRSGADRRLVLAEAQSKLNYSKDAFANGWAQVLSKCARLVKDVIPGDFSIWAKNSATDFDVDIKKSDFREPFNFYVEFSPISEEDEYRRHQDLMEMFNSGLYTKQHARSKLSDVDVKALEKQELKELLKTSPQYLQLMSDMFAGMLQKALTDAGVAPMMSMGQQMGGQQMGGQASMGQGRLMVPGVPTRQANVAPENPYKPKTGQGRGGGGNTQFGVKA